MRQVWVAAAIFTISAVATAQQWSAPISIITGPHLHSPHNTTPKVAVDPDGKIAVAWISQYRDGTSVTERLYSNVHVAYSADSGQQWSPPAQLSELAYYNSEPDISPGAAGEFLFAWTSGDLFSTYRLHNAITTDAGATYTTETIIGQGPANEFDHLNPQVAIAGSAHVLAKSSWNLTLRIWPGRIPYSMGGHIWSKQSKAEWEQAALADLPRSATECNTLSAELIKAGDTNLIAVFHQDYAQFSQYYGPATFYQQALVLTSADNGQSWVNRGRVTPQSMQLRELTAAYGQNGTTIIAGTETAVTLPYIWLARSTDSGVAWPSGFGLPQPGTLIDYWGQPSITTDGNGNWLLAIYAQNIETTANGYGTDGDILYTMSTDDGVNWSALAPVSPDPDTDTAIDTTPAAAYLGAGQWGIFWSRNEGTANSDIVMSTIDTDGASVADWQLF